MAEPALRHVLCASPVGLHRLAYWEWGDARATKALVCVHGLTRNGRDFDALAERLSPGMRVICPDMAGRGASDKLADPKLYAVPQYVADCVTLIARLDVESVAWLGTSMGGLIGMALAALPRTPISRLVLNDIGPQIDPAGLARIGSYVGRSGDFASFEEGEAAMRALIREFGPHTEAQYSLLSRHYVVRVGDRWRFHYDPAIQEAFRSVPAGPIPPVWPLYDAIACPTLVIRGAQSDILSAATADEMTRRGPRAERVDVDGVGHAPTLIADAQIDIVERFLAG